ncbi:MAG: hypothetical protein QOI13_421 [Paraburkholderia sp.]|jgi:hypothetical protein|nr:hypothetical protein [Paraburkholderia sp.]
MATKEQKPITKQPDDADKGQADQAGTFETDISESGDDGTTVRQAEVNEDDLSETKPSPKNEGGGA